MYHRVLVTEELVLLSPSHRNTQTDSPDEEPHPVIDALKIQLPMLRERSEWVSKSTLLSMVEKEKERIHGAVRPKATRPSSPPRAVIDRHDPVCVRILHIPPSTSFDEIEKYLDQFGPVLMKSCTKSVAQASFATPEEARKMYEAFDWDAVEKS